uniref:NADH dehydrogenase subunit 2 n=1 Tax=Saldoida armata TaxID=2715442 RepID=UPI002E7722C5|nr:NADH dehydrogenase subunit 2 [Saldoida armata]WQB61737.1 NADH dehydrogenase subunit 2 [Saldoida armata]
MAKNSSTILFSIVLITSTLFVMSSNNWLSSWIGMEMNLMAFIPMMHINNNNFNSESCMMYFLVQTMGSILFLMSILLMPMIMTSPIMMNSTMNYLLMTSMLIKTGLAPFHMWVPEVMNKMNWMNCMLMTTWQKLAPMTVMSSFIYLNKMIMVPIILSTIMGAMGGINQTSVRKIMAYSSITHSGWMTACMYLEHKMWMMYMTIYTAMNITLMVFFKKNAIFYINQIQFVLKTMFNKMNLTFMMMSMSGMPPFIGFLPKWTVIQALMSEKMMFSMIIMMMSTLMTTFYYLRLMSTIYMMSYSVNKLMLKEGEKCNNMMFMLNMMLPMVTIYSLL